MTNREWLESLTDEKLSNFLSNTYQLPNGMFVGINNLKTQDCYGCYVFNSYGVKKWLQEEHVSNVYSWPEDKEKK